MLTFKKGQTYICTKSNKQWWTVGKEYPVFLDSDNEPVIKDDEYDDWHSGYLSASNNQFKLKEEQPKVTLDEPQAEKVEAHLAEHWNEDIGNVLWWDFPVEEPPYCGTPLDEHFPKYKTHFTTIDMPNEIEKPKRWIVKYIPPFVDEFRYYSMDDEIFDITESSWTYDKEDAYPFTEKEKADAAALLVNGTVEEVAER
ncbi:hypothetical protein [Enterococcus durans]|uniref:hypothetical protein n=1 Tax=Enterococcus durans TaxID=53345 RepID=UPI0021AFBEBD|nr:hypothetical protein [Enterococcus durans]